MIHRSLANADTNSVKRQSIGDIRLSFSITGCADYNLVKPAILRSYEMAPKAYRLKFRVYQKEEKRTYAEFFRQKKTYLDRWSTAKGVGSNHDKLRQLILMEEFKVCVHDKPKVFPNERQIDTAYDMVNLSDEYTPTHKRRKPKTNNPFENGSCTNP